MDRFGFFTDRPSFLFLRSITINLVKIALGQIARVFRLSSLSPLPFLPYFTCSHINNNYNLLFFLDLLTSNSFTSLLTEMKKHYYITSGLPTKHVNTHETPFSHGTHYNTCPSFHPNMFDKPPMNAMCPSEVVKCDVSHMKGRLVALSLRNGKARPPAHASTNTEAIKHAAP